MSNLAEGHDRCTEDTCTAQQPTISKAASRRRPCLDQLRPSFLLRSQVDSTFCDSQNYLTDPSHGVQAAVSVELGKSESGEHIHLAREASCIHEKLVKCSEFRWPLGACDGGDSTARMSSDAS